jgi:hypothetical protein
VDHLRAVTPKENCLADHTNTMGAQNARKTECSICGAPFSFRPNGYRYCKPCMVRKQIEYQRKYRARPGWNTINAANVARYRAKKKKEEEKL